MIPVSVVIVTKNESKNIPKCLEQLTGFSDVWVVDSGSRDKTADLARAQNVHVVDYQWNGQYPKKRQWCLNTLPLQFDWVFFVDADEIIPSSLINEIQNVMGINPIEAGFFVTGRYRLNGKILRYGLCNQKIALLHRHRMEFPVVDDLDIPGMGEVEGHYQPVPKINAPIGRLRNYMIHDALQDERSWIFRHEKYARWEAGMNAKGAWPVDPVPMREKAKQFLRNSAFRAEIVFLVGFFFRGGFLDGPAGLKFLKMRYSYLKMIKVMNLKG